MIKDSEGDRRKRVKSRRWHKYSMVGLGTRLALLISAKFEIHVTVPLSAKRANLNLSTGTSTNNHLSSPTIAVVGPQWLSLSLWLHVVIALVNLDAVA